MQVFKMSVLFFVFRSCFSTAPSQAERVYKTIGEDVVLSSPLVESPIENIEWKHNGDMAAEMYGNKLRCFLQFEGRCEVNTDTGALTIKGLKMNDSGIYTPEINYNTLKNTELSVISHVTKPSIIKSCNTEMTNCNLTCEGNTTEAEPITYKWFFDDIEGPLGKVWTISKGRVETNFRCVMKNPVSRETSDHFKNPFIIHAVPVYGAKGADVILRPPPMMETIRSIQWKHDGNIAAEWYGNKSECLGQFEGRCEVNTSSGELTIKRLKSNDSGIYTPEINGRDSSKTQLSVISPVAKPSVKTSCNTEMTNCLLTCEGNTAEAEPMNYTWSLDGMKTKTLTITKDTKVDSIRCMMMNPVSSETSESIKNPFKQERNHLASILAPVLVIVLVAAIAVAAYFIYKHSKERNWRPNNRHPNDNQQPSNGTNIPVTQNGLSGAGTEEEMTPLKTYPDGEATESATPSTSNKSPGEAVALNIDQEDETTCEPSVDEQRADDGGDGD